MQSNAEKFYASWRYMCRTPMHERLDFEGAEDKSFDRLDVVICLAMGCLAWVVLKMLIKFFSFPTRPERCIYYLSNETNEEKVKNIENLLSHVALCRDGLNCPRNDCIDFKLNLNEDFFDDDEDISSTSSGSSDDSSDDNSDDSSDDSSDNSSDSSSDDSLDVNVTSKTINDDKCSRSDYFCQFCGKRGLHHDEPTSTTSAHKSYFPQFAHYTARWMLPKGIDDETDDDVQSDESGSPDQIGSLDKIGKDFDPWNIILGIDKPKKETAVQNQSDKKTYSDIFGFWDKMDETRYQSLIDMLYNSENWILPNAAMIQELSSVFNIDPSLIETWFQNKRNGWRTTSAVSSLQKNDDSLNATSSMATKNNTNDKSDLRKKLIDDDHRIIPFFDFLFKSKNWKHPTAHMLKVLKVITGRRCRDLRLEFEHFFGLEELDKKYAQSSTKLTPKREPCTHRRLQFIPSYDPLSPNGGVTYYVPRSPENTSWRKWRTSVDEKNSKNSTLRRDSENPATYNAAIADPKARKSCDTSASALTLEDKRIDAILKRMINREISGAAETSDNSASVPPTAADQSASKNSAAPGATGASATNPTNEPRRSSRKRSVLDSVLIIPVILYFILFAPLPAKARW